MRRLIFCIFAATAATSALAAQKEPLHIAPELAIAADAELEDWLKECPFAAEFSTVLSRNLAKREGFVFTAAPLPTPTGRSFHVELVDLASTGNAFIGHDGYMRLRGTLYDNGTKLASFNSRFSFKGDLQTHCYSVRMAMRAEAWYVAKWLKDPKDGVWIKHIGQ